jgi:hypothetical protein
MRILLLTNQAKIRDSDESLSRRKGTGKTERLPSCLGKAKKNAEFSVDSGGSKSAHSDESLSRRKGKGKTERLPRRPGKAKRDEDFAVDESSDSESGDSESGDSDEALCLENRTGKTERATRHVHRSQQQKGKGDRSKPRGKAKKNAEFSVDESGESESGNSNENLSRRKGTGKTERLRKHVDRSQQHKAKGDSAKQLGKAKNNADCSVDESGESNSRDGKQSRRKATGKTERLRSHVDRLQQQQGKGDSAKQPSKAKGDDFALDESGDKETSKDSDLKNAHVKKKEKIRSIRTRSQSTSANMERAEAQLNVERAEAQLNVERAEAQLNVHNEHTLSPISPIISPRTGVRVRGANSPYPRRHLLHSVYESQNRANEESPSSPATNIKTEPKNKRKRL